MLHSKQNIWLQTLHQDENANEDALQFKSYLLNICKRQLQVDKKESIELPPSLTTVTDIFSVINVAFPDISANHHNKSCMSERAVLTTRNIQFENINDKDGSMV